MSGEILALLSAMFYGVAGVTISKSKASAVGDNGVFLSVLVTCFMTLGLWASCGSVSLNQVATWDTARGLIVFALAGVCATVLGRTTMYRAVEMIGAVNASLFRRLIPIFSLPCGLVLLGEWPEPRVLIGGAIIMFGVLCYQLVPRSRSRILNVRGVTVGIASALFYALAYSLRRLGLEDIPDPVFGALLGAVVGLVWLPVAAAFSCAPAMSFRRLLSDRSAWHWATALSLGAGQTLQFLALSLAPVSTVAVLGALDIFFSAALVAVFMRTERFDGWMLGVAGGMAVLGSAIMFS